MLDVPNEIRFLFPSAPLSLNLGFGESRAWWILDMDRLTHARAQGQWDELTQEIPAGLQPARDQMMKFLSEAERHMNIPPQHLVIGGFSQGAMLACDLVLRTDLPIAALVFMSGSIISRDVWISSLPHRKGLPVFQSHGTDDPLLSFAVAQQLRDAFIAGGLEVDWNEFRGGHEIPIQVLHQLGLFLRRVFS
jgi:phospholipase/carboxylesterase